MTHYSVLVIGPDVEKQLQPYHEYECTGMEDEYVVDVDVTDEMIADHAKYGKGEQLAAFVDGWSGARLRDGRYYNRTNPNKKWDWWVIGGRYTGRLKLKPGARGLTGKPGLMTEPAPPGYADAAAKGAIDLDQMRNDQEVKARALWKSTRALTGGSAWESWDDTVIRYPNIEDARREYHGQPAIELLKASGRSEYSWEIDDDLALDEAIYVARQRLAACAFYAFVRDGQWSERGEVGWFGTATNEISASQWHQMFNDMLDALPDDTELTVVDCHI